MLTMSKIKQGVCKVVSDYPVKRVELFGSYSCQSQTDKSDVDLLVEFTSAAISLLTISRLRCQMEEELGIEVDIVHAPVPSGSFLNIGKTVTLYEE